MSNKSFREAYRKGQQAYRNGSTSDDCPYSTQFEVEAWEDGFFDQMAQDSEENDNVE
jgi:ribosome modulation factor